MCCVSVCVKGWLVTNTGVMTVSLSEWNSVTQTPMKEDSNSNEFPSKYINIKCTDVVNTCFPAAESRQDWGSHLRRWLHIE